MIGGPAPAWPLSTTGSIQMGGAENVLEEFVDLFPGAPVYTSMYGPDKMPDSYRNWTIRTTFMQRLPLVTDRHQAYLPLYPAAFQTTDLSGFNLILSNKSGFCHGVTSRKGPRKSTARLLLPYANALSVALRPVPPEGADRQTARSRAKTPSSAAATLGLRRRTESRLFYRHQQRRTGAHPHDLRSRQRNRSPSGRYPAILSRSIGSCGRLLSDRQSPDTLQTRRPGRQGLPETAARTPDRCRQWPRQKRTRRVGRAQCLLPGLAARRTYIGS